MVITRPVTTGTPRQAQMDRALVMRLAATEYERVAGLLQTLSTTDWEQPTDCSAWDVRAMAAHVLGMAEMAAIGPRAARGRSRTPGFIRGMRMPIDQSVGNMTEPLTFGYLIDIILTRDPWMHRVDISRAIGRPMLLTPEHDGNPSGRE